MILLKQSTARNIPFFMVDSTDSITGKTGLSPTVLLSKDGGAFGAAGGSVTEIANGWYNLAANTTDTATLGCLALHATAAGTDPCDPPIMQIVLDLPGASVSSVSGAVGSVTAGVTVTTNNDKTGYTASTVSDKTGYTVSTVSDKTGYSLSSGGIQAIWDALTSALTTTGSIGKMLVANLTGDIFSRLGAPAGASVSADIAAIKSQTNGISSIPTADNSSNITAIKAKTDNLPAAPAAQSDVTTVGTAATNIYNRLGAPAGASVSADIAAVKGAIGIPKNVDFPNFSFPMLDSSGAPVTGLTVVAKRSIDGGAFATCANPVVEIGRGKYKTTLAAADLNGTEIALEFSAAGAQNTDYTVKAT